MKRGAGRMLQAALNSHKYANGGMVTPGSTPISNQMPVQHFDRGGSVTTPDIYDPTKKTYSMPTGMGGVSQQVANPNYTDPRQTNGYTTLQVYRPSVPGFGANPYYTAPTWTGAGITNEQQFYQNTPQFSAAPYTAPGSRGEHGETTGGGRYYASKQDAANAGAWGAYGNEHGYFPSGGSFGTEAFKAIVMNPASLAAIGAYAFAPAAGASAAESGGMSMVPPSATFGQTASGATMSTAPSGYASGAGYMGGAAAGATSGYDPYSSSSWQNQNSSQVPGSGGGFDYGQSSNMSTVPGSGGFDPYGLGGAASGTGGIGVGDAPFDFGASVGEGAYGPNAASVNPDFIPQSGSLPNSLQTPAYGSNSYTNAGFNSTSFDTAPYASGQPTGFDQVGSDIARNPYDTQLGQPQIQADTSVLGRVKSGLMGRLNTLPEAAGAALPGMAIGLGAQLALGRKGSAQNDPGYGPAQQQVANDAARNQIALTSQQEFANNASKYGTDDYYRQMGDMSAMQFRSGRVQQRQLLQQQLQAQGRDPATVNALLQNFDNNTETGSVNSRNSSYLSARNSGLGAQQAAAGMFAPGSGASALSQIGNNADQRTSNQINNITRIVGAPFTQQGQTQGRQSGQVATDAADAAAKTVSDKTFGLDSSVYGRQ